MIGCLLALPVHGLSTGATNMTSFSELAFKFRITPGLLVDGLVFSAVMGAVGGLLPAIRAARIPVARALREICLCFRTSFRSPSSGSSRRRRCSSSWSRSGGRSSALWAVSHFLRAIGLTLPFHRYFAHRSFQMNRVARFVWALIGTAAMQKGPLWWAGHHVNHHRYADRDGDPHSPTVSGFYYAHIGWFLNDAKHDRLEPSNPVDPRFLEGAGNRAARALLLRPAGRCWPLAMYLVGGLPWLVWGFCLPTMTLAHATFAINTVNHMFGSRRFETRRRVAQQRRSPRSSPPAKAGTTTITAISARRATGSTGGNSIRPGT